MPSEGADLILNWQVFFFFNPGLVVLEIKLGAE